MTGRQREMRQRIQEGGKRIRVTMTVISPPGATLREVKNFLYELEWVGGCRDPKEDPMFHSLLVQSASARNYSNKLSLTKDKP